MQRTWIGAAAIAAMLAGAATASTVTVDRDGGSGGGGISGMSLAGYSTSFSATGGSFDFDVSNDGDNALGGISRVTTFCIELNEQVGGGAYNNVTVLQGSGIVGTAQTNDGDAPDPGKITTRELRQLSWLFDNHYADVTAAGASSSDIRAFQLLVWEIVYEDRGNDDSDNSVVDLGAGDFQKSGGVAGTAGSWVGAFTSAAINSWDINENLVVLTRSDFQDQITMIPLPASALMGLAGLGGVLVARRRMRQA